MIIPKDVRAIILDYHDEYGLLEKRKRMLHQISYGYQLWLRHMGASGNCFYHRTEYAAKLTLRRYALFPPYFNHEWKRFLFYFKLAQFLADLFLNDEPATPTELAFLLPY